MDRSIRVRSRRRTALATVHRVGAAALGLALWVFGILGLVDRLGFFETTGQPVLELNSNGLLSIISLVVGAALIVSGVRGGPTASTVTAVVGVLFLLSALLNLAVLDSDLNFLAFTISNVFFSLVSGMLLLTLGLYGRVSGGLPADNPYRQARQAKTAQGTRHPGDPAPDPSRDAERTAELDKFAHAEQLGAEGLASQEQERMVERDRSARAQAEHDRAWAHARRDPGANVDRERTT